MFAGEMSGHIFFKDNFGFDDGIYAAVKLLNIVADLKNGLADKISTLPQTFNTPEIKEIIFIDSILTKLSLKILTNITL